MVEFKQSDTSAELRVKLPGNMTADVILPTPPGTETHRVMIGNRLVRTAPTYRVGGGAETRFTWMWRQPESK